MNYIAGTVALQLVNYGKETSIKSSYKSLSFIKRLFIDLINVLLAIFIIIVPFKIYYMEI